eukprot:1538648-Amphidinium_carterae.1
MAGMDVHSTWWTCPNPCCRGWQWARQHVCSKCGCRAPGWVAKLVSGKQAGHSGRSRGASKKHARRSHKTSGEESSATGQSMSSEHDSSAEAEVALGATKEELLVKLQKLEQAQKLLQATGANGADDEVAQAIAETRVALRAAEPTSKRLHSLQEGVERRRQKLAKVDQQISDTEKSLAGLEQEMQTELDKVRAQFDTKRGLLQQHAAKLQAQKVSIEDGLSELRQTQGELVGNADLTCSDLAVLGPVMGALSARMPQYQQVFVEMQSVAAEQFGGLADPGVLAKDCVDRPLEPPPPKRRQTGAGVFSTQLDEEDNHLDTPVRESLATPVATPMWRWLTRHRSWSPPGRGRHHVLPEVAEGNGVRAPRVRESRSVTATKQWVAVTANCTAWGSLQRQVEAWRVAEQKRPQLLLVQEHHLEAWKRPAAAVWARRNGCRSHFTDHCAILVRNHIACRQVEFELPEGRGCAVRVAGLRSSTLLVVSLYLRTGLGPEQQLDILGAVVEMCVREGCQFLLGGDWQLTPEQLLHTGFLQTIDAVLLRTHHTTCWSGAQRELDFFVASRAMALQAHEVSVDPCSITRPHDALRLVLSGSKLRELVPVLVKCPAGVSCRPVGPALKERAHAWSWREGERPESIGTAFAEWAREVNAWRVQFEGGDCPNRGMGPRVQWKRLDAMVECRQAPLATPWVTACRWLWARCQQCLGQRGWSNPQRARGQPWNLQRILEPVQLCGEEWYLEDLFSTLRGKGLLQVGLLLTEVHDMLQEAERVAAQERRGSWKDWAKDACTAGAAPAHKWLRGAIPVPPQPGMGDIGLVGVAALNKVAQEWTDIWALHEPFVLPPVSEMEALPVITLEGLQQSLATYGAKKRGGSEGFNLRAISWLPRGLLVRFLDIMLAFEGTGVVPDELSTLTILLPKPGAIHATRPIGLSACVLRAWSRYRVQVLRQWEQVYLRASHWGTGSRCCERAAWAHQLLVEGNLGSKLALGTWLVDLRKFYEYVAHKDLFADCRLARVPLTLLRLAIAFYQGPKCIVWEGLCTVSHRYAGGMIPGCSCAPGLARAFLTPLLAHLESMGPGKVLFSVIDDLAITRHGVPEQVLHGLCAEGEYALSWFAQRGLPISPGKCQLLGSTPGIRRGLQLCFGERGFVLAQEARHLGIDVSATRRRCSKVKRAKFGVALRKLRRLRQLRTAGGKIVNVAGSGPLASVLWGAEVWGLTILEIRKLRSGLVRAARNWPLTCGTDLPFIYCGAFGHKDPGAIHHGRVLAAWAGAMQEGILPQEALQAALYNAARSLVKARQPWRSVHGPAGTLLLVACRLGWSMQDHLSMVTDLGRRMPLLECSGQDLTSEAVRATIRGIGTKVTSGLGQIWSYPARLAMCKLTALERACLEVHLCKGSWCQERLWRHGMVAQAECKACGRTLGNTYHRVFQCPLWDCLRAKCFSLDLRAWLGT